MRESRGFRLSREQAEAVAVQALGFLAENPEALGRFLSLAGLGPTNLRAAAGDPGFLSGVVDYMLGDEALLLSFAESAGIKPAMLGEIGRRLGEAA
jgi:hypothetical protein